MAHREMDGQIVLVDGYPSSDQVVELLQPRQADSKMTEEELFLIELKDIFTQPGDDKEDNDSPLYEVDPAFAPQNCKSGALVCLLCSFASPNPNTLKRHVCNHLKKPRFDRDKKQMMIMCLACGFENENNYVMAGHLRTHDKLVHSYMSLANNRTRVMGEVGSPLPLYQCQLCEFNGSSASDVILHVKKHHHSEDFLCKSCNMDCQNLGLFLEHKNEHQSDRNICAPVRPLIKNQEDALHCPLCSFTSSSMKDTLAHIETHNNVDVIACPSCNCRFHSSVSLKEHSTVHENGGVCAKCSEVKNINLSSFEGVVFCDSSTEPKRFHCTMCDFSTIRASSMTRHLQRHTLPPIFKCEYCSFSSDQSSVVKEHCASCSKAPRASSPEIVTYEWWCSDCSSVFYTGEKLAEHVRNVHGVTLKSEKDDIVATTCRQCGHQSSSIEEDKKHYEECHQKKKIRYVSKPYTPRGVFYCCMECDYQTKKVSSLKHHMSSHENLPRYLCSKCSRSFKTEDDYRVHELLIHADKAKVLECGECSTPVAPSEMYEHYKANHPSKLRPEVMDTSNSQTG